MKKLLTSICLSTLAFAASSGELIVHTASAHTVKEYTLDDVSKKINNSNIGLGYRTDDGVSIGMYRNSYNFNTVYLTQEFMYNEYLGIIVGFVSGYETATGKLITPMVASTLKIPVNDTVTLNLVAMPKFKELAGVIHLAVSYKF